MSSPVAKIYSTPRGKSKFYEMFMEGAASKSFIEKIMKPMPMIVSPSGPIDASRHWDWKARGELDIVLPEKKTMIVFDEVSDIKIESWKTERLSKYADMMLEGAFTATTAQPETTLTMDKMNEAFRALEGGDIMARKIPKKPKGDIRKKFFTPRMFGHILLSTTSQIENNAALNDALIVDGVANATVDELIAPLFEEFFHNHGDKWQVTGPMTLAAQSVESGKWKSVSALGGEILHYHSAIIGKRDGICLKWTTGNIVGLDEEMMIDTTVKSFGDKLVHAELGGNPANRASILDVLLDFAGEADVVTAAEAAKERVRVAVAAQLKQDIERKSEAYGESFGSWA